MKTKCPNQPMRILTEENHRYAPHPNIEPLSKNASQSLKNPFTHPKCISHLWPKCNLEKSLCLKISLKDSKAYTLTPWPYTQFELTRSKGGKKHG
jgi:hypothetical protein